MKATASDGAEASQHASNSVHVQVAGSCVQQETLDLDHTHLHALLGCDSGFNLGLLHLIHPSKERSSHYPMPQLGQCTPHRQLAVLAPGNIIKPGGQCTSLQATTVSAANLHLWVVNPRRVHQSDLSDLPWTSYDGFRCCQKRHHPCRDIAQAVYRFCTQATPNVIPSLISRLPTPPWLAASSAWQSAAAPWPALSFAATSSTLYLPAFAATVWLPLPA